MVTLLVIAGVLVVGAICIAPNWRRHQELRERVNDLSAELEAKRLELSKLKENQWQFKHNRDFLEHVARQEGRVYPGELVFIFEER